MSEGGSETWSAGAVAGVAGAGRPDAPWQVPTGPRGLVAGAPRWVKVGLALVVALYLAYSSFGIAGPFLWGHHGYHGGTYTMRARMTLRFGLVVPATAGGFDQPPDFHYYYLHHPIGYHHLLVPVMAVLGDAEWVSRLCAVVGGLFALFALYRLVSRWWSPAAGLLAVAVYVTLPVLCSFSVLSDPMLLELACCLIACEAFLRFLERPGWRPLLTAQLALCFGGFLMWEVYFQAFFHGLYALAWWAKERGRAAKVGGLPAPLLWFLGTFVATVLPFGFHFWFTRHVGMMDDFFGSFQERSTAGILWAMGAQRHWLELLYGLPALIPGVLWLALYLFRFTRGQTRRRDQAVLLCFLINTLYIFLFRKGAAVHLYRVFFYSGFLALAITDLVVELSSFVSRHRQSLRDGLLSGAVATLAYFAFELPHSLHNLLESREMMGTHGHIGYNSDAPKQRFGKEVGRLLDKDDFYYSFNLSRRIEFNYYVDRRDGFIPNLGAVATARKEHPKSVVLFENRLPPPEQKRLFELLRTYSARLYSPYMMLDLRTEHPEGTTPGATGVSEFREYRFEPQRMTPVWRYFYSHKYPRLEPVPVFGPYSQCVYAYLGRKPPAELPAPTVPLVSATAPLEPLVCYYNFLVATGETEKASKFFETLAPLLRPLGPGSNPAVPELGTLIALRRRGRSVELWLRIDKQRDESVPSAASKNAGEAPPETARPLYHVLSLVSASGRYNQSTELVRSDGGNVWDFQPRPGQLVVVEVPASPGRYHMQVISREQNLPQKRFGPPFQSTLDLGEVDIP